MSEVTYIKDIDEFLHDIRILAYKTFIEINDTKVKEQSPDEFSKKIKENEPKIDDVLGESESKNIIIPLLKKHNGRYTISEKKILKIMEKLNSRIVSNSINKLVSQDIFEIAYDNEVNDFVFWVKK